MYIYKIYKGLRMRILSASAYPKTAYPKTPIRIRICGY